MKPLRWNFKHWQLREKRGGPKGGYGEEPGLESHIMQSVFRHPRAQQCLRILLTKPGRLLRTASLHTWHCWTLLLSCWMLGSVSCIKFYISLLWLTIVLFVISQDLLQSGLPSNICHGISCGGSPWSNLTWLSECHTNGIGGCNTQFCFHGSRKFTSNMFWLSDGYSCVWSLFSGLTSEAFGVEVGVAFQSLSEDWQRDCQRIVTCHNLNGLDPTVTLESEAMSFDWKLGVHLEKSCCNQLVHVECRCMETKRFYFACLLHFLFASHW